MAVFKCKMCGGDLEILDNATVCECEYCGTKQTVPTADNEKKYTLFNRANKLRLNNEFDKAAGIYESIVSEFPEEAESYWGLVLCKYGIEYVDDKKTAKKIPTCHRTVPSTVLEDENFIKAIECADTKAKTVYKAEAKVIDKLQKQILKIVEAEEPYDVFICYKETDSNGQRTEDSAIAQDIYTELVKEGYRVFFSRVTLRDKAGTDYEPYIYSALNSAKVMLAIGTKEEYYDAVWVKNEWGRYLSMMVNDKSKHLIPCYKDIDAYDIPNEFKNLQALNMAEVTFFKSLLNNIQKFVKKQDFKIAYSSSNQGVSVVTPLLERAYMFLEDGEFEIADKYGEKILDKDPKNAEAYLIKLMAELGVKNKSELVNCEKSFDKNSNYEKVVRFANEDLQKELQGYIRTIKLRNLEKTYQMIVSAMEKAETTEQFFKIAKGFELLGNYKKSKEFFEVCSNKAQDIELLLEEKRKQYREKTHVISAGGDHCVVLNSNGKIFAFGSNEYGQTNVGDLNDVVSVSCGMVHTVGLKADGTVVAVGNNGDGQCDVSEWTDIIEISAGDHHTIGLRADGTVVAVGDNTQGQCKVSGWKDVVGISAGAFHTVALKSDGTVVAVGFNKWGQCNVENYKDIIQVSAYDHFTALLKTDGNVAVVNNSSFSKCDTSRFVDIVAISMGGNHLIGMKIDGTAIATGEKRDGQCDIENWSDLVAVSAGVGYTIGLKSSGEIIAVGNNYHGRCDVDKVKSFN